MGQRKSAGRSSEQSDVSAASRSLSPEQQTLIETLAEEELGRLKSRFISAMTHELRTPLASLRLAAGLLVSAPPAGATEDQQQLFQLILRSGDRLDLLITSLLEYARLEARHLRLNLQTFDLRPILESAADLLEPHYRARGQTLELHLPEQGVTVRGDPFHLRTMAQALLDTACKRAPAGGKLSIGCRAEGGTALGWVCDTGPQVPAEERERLFTGSYWQMEEDPPGLAAFGLGVPFARKLIQLHGGGLWLADPETPGEGACFHFSLPLAHT